jgi:hypothetical protein
MKNSNGIVLGTILSTPWIKSTFCSSSIATDDLVGRFLIAQRTAAAGYSCE